MEWLQAGALGPQEAPPPPWQSRLHQYSTGRAGEALTDSHWLTNLKVSCFYCKWEAQGILKTKGWSPDSRSRIFLLLGSCSAPACVTSLDCPSVMYPWGNRGQTWTGGGGCWTLLNQIHRAMGTTRQARQSPKDVPTSDTQWHMTQAWETGL